MTTPTSMRQRSPTPPRRCFQYATRRRLPRGPGQLLTTPSGRLSAARVSLSVSFVMRRPWEALPVRDGERHGPRPRRAEAVLETEQGPLDDVERDQRDEPR